MQFGIAGTYLGTELDGRYRLLRLIGEGASSWVFAAQDLRLERDVAVKLLKPSGGAPTEAARTRLVNEGRTLARLIHPHIVTVHDAGHTQGGLVYLVMELSQTGTLEDELEACSTLTPAQALALILPLMGALACAHDRGVIHRDIKPANIALLREGDSLRAKLLDFGIARRHDAHHTASGAVGTPAYMSPEQARAQPLAPATDVWSVGVVFFRCLTGELPFAGDTVTGVLRQTIQQRAPHIRDVAPGLPPNLSVALDVALEPDVRVRYRDMRSFACALAHASRRDGISVPSQPDLLGLPLFAQWCASADQQQTQPVPAAMGEVPAAAVPELSQPVALLAQRTRSTRTWLGLLLALIALAAWGARTAVLGASRPASDTARRSPSARISASPAQASTAAPAAEPRVAALPAAAQASPQSPPAPDIDGSPPKQARSSKKKKQRAVTAPHDEGRSGAAEQGFVTSWEW